MRRRTASRRPRVAVVGDALLDVDVVGSVDRVAPDAPAMVLRQQRRSPRPGGAGLAAWLAADRGADVVLAAPVADDAPAEELVALLADRVELVRLPDRGATAVKTRLRSAGQTLMRTDLPGQSAPVAAFEELRGALAGADAVLVSDYGRGFTAEPWVREQLAEAAARVPVVWDPHPRGTAPVRRTLVATPNRDELVGLAGLAREPGPTRMDWLQRATVRLVERWQIRAAAVTLGEEGALLSYGDATPLLLPIADAPSQVGDTCGAGDRFSGALAAALAQGDVLDEAVACSVQVAAEFVRHGAASSVVAGAAPGHRRAPAGARSGRASAGELVEAVRASGGTVVAAGGCFDLLHVGHVETLRAARALGDCLVVLVNSDASVARLKGPGRPLVPERDRARVLQALDCVDAVVVFDEDTPEQALRSIRPDVWAKGGDYAVEELPERRVLEEWGGQAVLLPFLAGHSTTRMVETARSAG